MTEFDQNGVALCDVQDLIEIALADQSWDNCQVKENEHTKQFNHLVKTMDTEWKTLVFYQQQDQTTFDKANQNSWFTPQPYASLNIRDYLQNICQDLPSEYQHRAMLELELFEQANMIEVLKHLIYLVETFKSNNIVWGPGRGSACASLVLYLLNVHFVDPVKYDLDINEFFKVV